MTENTVQIQLNGGNVINPLLKQLAQCQSNVLFGLRSVDIIKEDLPSFKGESSVFAFNIGSVPANIEEQKEEFKKWLIKKGFEDLIKGIKAALIEALLYIKIYNKKDDIKNYGDFLVELEAFKKQSKHDSLPALFKAVNTSLTRELKYKEHVTSINDARNCLVHANGIVTDKYINENNLFVLKGIRLKLFTEVNNEEAEVKPGIVIEAGNSIKLGAEEFFIQYKLGDEIELNYTQFNNIIMSCYYFGIDLKDSLPNQ